jgi:hypothetical protein
MIDLGMDTIADVRNFIADLPDDTPIVAAKMDDPEFVIVVDSAGQARRVMTKNKRTFMFLVTLPMAS